MPHIYHPTLTMTTDESILQIIESGNVADQATLREQLRRAGHSLTQPTLSRHLKRLGVKKVRGAYRQIEQPANLVPAYELILAQPNLVILKTRPGHAQVLAVLLDAESLPGAAGSVAGDDTVFIAAQSPDDLAALAAHIRALLDRPRR